MFEEAENAVCGVDNGFAGISTTRSWVDRKLIWRFPLAILSRMNKEKFSMLHVVVEDGVCNEESSVNISTPQC